MSIPSPHPCILAQFATPTPNHSLLGTSHNIIAAHDSKSSLLTPKTDCCLALFDWGREAAYEINDQMNIVSVIPIHSSNKSKMSSHVTEICNQIAHNIKKRHPETSPTVINNIGYRVFFYMPEEISIPGFTRRSQTQKDVLDKNISCATFEYVRELRFNDKFELQLDMSLFAFNNLQAQPSQPINHTPPIINMFVPNDHFASATSHNSLAAPNVFANWLIPSKHDQRK